MAIYSRILKEFHVLKENFKKFFLIIVHDISHIPVVINENSKEKVKYSVFLVYLSLWPSSHEILAYPSNMYGHPVNTANFFSYRIILSWFHCIGKFKKAAKTKATL